MLDDFLKLIANSSQHKCFYHFTDHRNIEMIRKSDGILSMQLQRMRGIMCEAPGGNEWSRDADKRIGMDAFVHLCFFDSHPMEYEAKKDGRIERTAWLKIDPSVLRIPGAKITFEVSNKSGVIPIDAVKALENLDHEVIYNRTDWTDVEIKERRKAAKKCEILVPDIVSLRYVLNLDG